MVRSGQGHQWGLDERKKRIKSRAESVKRGEKKPRGERKGKVESARGKK